MKSTIDSARNILGDQDWTGQPYICIFVGGSTIHIGVVEADGTLHTAEPCDAKTPSADITTALRAMTVVYNKTVPLIDREVRVLLAGSPTMVTTRFRDRKAGDYTFFETDQYPTVDTIDTTHKMEYIAELAGKRVTAGGLDRGDGTNPGQKILKFIYDAMNDDWVIACGNRNLVRDGNKPFYCTDSTYATDHLPAGADPSDNFVVVSSGDVSLMQNFCDSTLGAKKSKYDKLVKTLKTAGAFNSNTVLLVTAGHTPEKRVAAAASATNWIREMRVRGMVTTSCFGRGFADRCLA